jgi:hypothetical protein
VNRYVERLAHLGPLTHGLCLIFLRRHFLLGYSRAERDRSNRTAEAKLAKANLTLLGMEPPPFFKTDLTADGVGPSRTPSVARMFVSANTPTSAGSDR